MIRGESYSIGVVFNHEYDIARIQEIQLAIDTKVIGKLSDGTIWNVGENSYRCELSGIITNTLRTNTDIISLYLDDSIRGIIKRNSEPLFVEPALNTNTSSSINTGYNLFIDVTVTETDITTDFVYLDAVRGRSAYESYLTTTTDNPVLTETQWSNLNVEISSSLITKANLDGGNIFTGDQTISGSLSITGMIVGDLLNSVSSSHALQAETSTSSSYSTQAASASYVSGSVVGNGSGLINIPVSAIEGLNLDRIASGSNTVIVSDKTRINNDTEITGSLIVSNGVTGSLYGTSSNSISASYSSNSTSASYSSTATSSSHALQSDTAISSSISLQANIATSASYSLLSTSASYSDQSRNATSASLAQQAISSSYSSKSTTSDSASQASNSDTLDGKHVSDFVLSGSKYDKLYQPDGTNPFVYTDNAGKLHVDGDIIQSGSIYETHAEQVYSTKDIIYLRSGSIGGLATGAVTGIQATKYDGTNDGQLGFDKDGWARVGDSGALQKLATIEETTANGYLMQYSTGSNQLKGIDPLLLPISTAISSSLSSKQDAIPFVTQTNNQFLRDDETFQTITQPIGGYANNLYFSEIASDVTGYETLSYTPDASQTLETFTVQDSEGNKILKNYIYPNAVGITLIPEGLSSAHFVGKVSNISAITQIGITYFKRTSLGAETDLFTMWSDAINSLTDINIPIQLWNTSFVVNSTDRMGYRVVARTTRTSNVTINWYTGDGNGAYVNNPNPIRHSNLRVKNEELAYQHIDQTAEKTTPIDADSVGLWDSVALKFVRTSLTNLITYIKSKLSKSDFLLGNVDNTSDANKPVSTAQQTALNLKQDAANTRIFRGDVAGTSDAITVTVSPAYDALTDKDLFYLKIVSANTTTTPTLNVSGKGAKTIVKKSGNALKAGDLQSGYYFFVYNSTLDKFNLMSPSMEKTSSFDADKLIPSADSTSAVQVMKADGTTMVMVLDTTNGRVGFGKIPTSTVDISGDAKVTGGYYIAGTSAAYDRYQTLTDSNSLTSIGNVNTGASSAVKFLSKNVEFLRGLPDQSMNTPTGKYYYMAASATADTLNDVRFYNNSGTFTVQKCTVANATKGGGTWSNILTA